MSVALEFIDLIIPIAVIEEKYPGGWTACRRDHERLIGRRVWFDTHLFRDGAASNADMKARVEGWIVLGFSPYKTVRGTRHWDDLCVVSGRDHLPTLPCEWLRVIPETRTAWFAGASRGERIGRRHFAPGAPRPLSRPLPSLAAAA